MARSLFLKLLALFLTIPFGRCFINFILIGSTGDLAKKYLWEALFVQYVENNLADSINIYAAATRNESEGFPIVQSYLDSLHCKNSWSNQLCMEGQRKFKERVSYLRLRNTNDYQILHSTISHENESLRVFYLSVSPSLYEDIASNINKHARPMNELRVVFEKPFGMDFASAVELSNKLSINLEESEIYRVDHYLGKAGMRAIIDFRRINWNLLSNLKFPSLESSSSSSSPLGRGDESCEISSPPESTLTNVIPNIEVVMKEKEHTGGRTVYYDQFGIIRDVMQNHLTQALVYSLMNLNHNLEEDSIPETFGQLTHRLHLLQQLKYSPSSLEHNDQCKAPESSMNQDNWRGIWLGQYATYINHLEEDLIEYARKSSTSPPSEVSSNTPTAASIIFEINLQNSNGICPREFNQQQNPIRVMIVAGKALETREMYVRVRSQEFENCSIIFGIQGGLDKYLGQSADNGPFILLEGQCWNQNQMELIIPEHWSVLPSACHLHSHISEIFQETETSSNDGSNCIIRPNYIFETATDNNPSLSSSSSSPSSNKYRNNAYIEILGALLRNDRSYFTTTEELLSQWKIWDHVLKDAECSNIHTYDIGWDGLDNR